VYSIFITGTDTDVGKTFVSQRILEAANAQGLSCVGYKPVAAGCEFDQGQWVNEDALALQQASSLSVTLAEVNPIALAPAIAPHIAAQEANQPIDTHKIVQGYEHLSSLGPDFLLMEGAGGWRLPLSKDHYLSEVVAELTLDVVLVVGMRLGCLNHALLTAEAIQHDGLKLKGWIANQVEPAMPYYQQNLASLDHMMPVPRLAEVTYNSPSILIDLAEISGI
jgi:dethiobiotin synthetase